MNPQTYNIEHLRCDYFAESGTSFDMISYEDFMQLSDLSNQVHRHNYYMILLATEGSGVQLIDFKDFTVEPGMVFLMYPGQVHAWRESRNLRGYLIFFTPEFFTLRYNTNSLLEFPFFNSNAREPFVRMKDRNSMDRLVTIFNLMYEEYLQNDEDSTKALRSYLNIVLVECKRYYEEQYATDQYKDKNAAMTLRQFKQLVDTHFKNKHLVRDYADLLLITPNYLNSICKRNLGQSAGEIIRERIVLEAKRLLLHDHRTVTEIGLELNFEDNSYFCRFFKKYAGLSPEKFRKKFQAGG